MMWTLALERRCPCGARVWLVGKGRVVMLVCVHCDSPDVGPHPTTAALWA